jgi:hypothetical protein
MPIPQGCISSYTLEAATKERCRHTQADSSEGSLVAAADSLAGRGCDQTIGPGLAVAKTVVEPRMDPCILPALETAQRFQSQGLSQFQA